MRLLLVLLSLAGSAAVLLSGCGDDGDQAPPPPAAESGAPWQRSEEREPCGDFTLLRNPFFGELHVHTGFSADAQIFGTRTWPRDAYRFARGEEIPLADDNEEQTRRARLERPLDFTAVTDHAEFFGEVDLCTTPESPVFDIEMCQVLRAPDDPGGRFGTTVRWLYLAGVPNPPPSHDFCSMPGVDCDAAAVSVWNEMQAAAEEFYDRSATCTFTTFVGYEHTPSPLGRHLHRNVIFRNDQVPAFAASYLETHAGGVPQGLWSAIEDDCLDVGNGCDAVIIPHNPNLSGGMQWLDPADAAEARRRQDREPLVEIHQQKGNSECRFDRLAGTGADTVDELCTFEQLVEANEGPGEPPPAIDDYPRRNLVRNTLKDGLLFEESLGVNPFELGFVGGTDSHNSTAGNVEETPWEGGQGNSDSSPARQIGNEMSRNPGGLTVVWAEENSRDALFAALRRRETYATSGTRPVVRFFAGDLSGLDCGGPDFVERAYATGTPMGGEIGASGQGRPRFAVLAVKDPGTAEHPGTDLQRIQIVKGWVDGEGGTRERVFDVAGDARNGATVDPATCAPVGKGASELCAVWEDPEFDRSERAFYYARVLENPTCRWSTLVCKQAGVDPFSPDCVVEAARAGEDFANCCLSEQNDPSLAPVVQERAWTSPVWYRPESIARVEGGIAFGVSPATDLLDLTARIGRLPAGFDPATREIELRLGDDADFYAVTIPAGALRPSGEAGRYVLEDTSGAIGGLRSATLTIDPDGAAALGLSTFERDLSGAARLDHAITVSLESDTYRSSHTRLWRLAADRLAPVAE